MRKARRRTPVSVALREENGFGIETGDFEAMVTPKTRMIIINTPQNPTGHVFSDEIYEKIVFEGKRHMSIASVPHMKEQTITINGFRKPTPWLAGESDTPWRAKASSNA